MQIRKHAVGPSAQDVLRRYHVLENRGYKKRKAKQLFRIGFTFKIDY